MTPERLKEIRERVHTLQHATLHGPVPLAMTMQLVEDLVELLELVEPREAESSSCCIAALIHSAGGH